MDIDWCLTCERRLEYSDSLYCSPECQSHGAGPSIRRVTEPTTTKQWAGNDYAGIAAWAAQIPAGAAPSSVSSKKCSPPNLLKPSRCLVAQTLPSPPLPSPPPSNPIITPRHHHYQQPRSSLRSAATAESSCLVATPPCSSKPVPISSIPSITRKQSIIDGMYSHFLQSWNSAVVPISKLPPKDDFSNQTTTHLVKILSSSDLSYEHQPSSYHNHHHHDDHPSFRTRGRKASRVAA